MTNYYKIGDIEFKVVKSPKKEKDKRAVFKDGTKIDFGAKEYPEYPNTKRGNDYCSRSFGMAKKNKTLGKVKNANTLSRKILWKCKGKQSKPSFKKAGVNIINKEEYFDSI